MELANETRDYDVYTDLMSDDPVVDVKYDDIRRHIRPGLVVDDGCGDAALLERVAEDYPDIALIGVDLSEEMLDRARARAHLGGFDDAVVQFLQVDMTRTVPRIGRADTVISSSTCHELWSYGDGDAILDQYFDAKWHELANRGRFIIRDVVGPVDPDRDIYLWLNSDDGDNTGIYRAFDDDAAQTDHLDRLSTDARYHRFAADFAGRDFTGVTDTIRHDGKELYRMPARDAAEYLLTKDYTDNWESEMQESFTHWAAADFADALTDTGFAVIHEETYTSPWIEEHRFDGTAAVYEETDDGLQQVDYPPTNIVIVGEKVVP